MKRAKKLLRASKVILDRHNKKEVFQCNFVIYMLTVIAMILTIKSIVLEENSIKEAMDFQFRVIQVSVVIASMTPLVALYTAFTENKRAYCKNSFNQFAIQLPVVKTDFIKAKFIDSIVVSLPSIILMSFMITMNIIFKRSEIMYIYIGLGVISFFLIMLISGIESGISNAIVLNMPVKYCFYAVIEFIICGLVMGTKGQESELILMLEKDSMWLIYLSQQLGGIWGGCALLVGIIVNYICNLKIPHIINKLRGSKYENL